MDAESDPDQAVVTIAAAIGEPTRARMLYCLMDGRARTSTELAAVADVSASTASEHLARLKTEGLVRVVAQGKHRYYSLGGADVARVLEGLSVLAGGARQPFVPGTPQSLRAARTCYDHIAGTLGVALHDRLVALGWLSGASERSQGEYDLLPKGARELEALGVEVARLRALRRRFAFPCLDWSERRAHLGGAVGAAVLGLALKRRWVAQDLDSRVLRVTRRGRDELLLRWGVRA